MDNQKKCGYLNIYEHMGTQNIIGTKLGGLDVSLDFSESFDFTLDDTLSVRLDAIADFSECFDFTMGNSAKDYILFEEFIPDFVDDDYLFSENDFIFKTEDDYYLTY